MNFDQQQLYDRLRRIDWARCGHVAYDSAIEEKFFRYITIAKEISRRIGTNRDLYRRVSGLFHFVYDVHGSNYRVPDYMDEWLNNEFSEDYIFYRGRSYVVDALRGYLLWPLLDQKEQSFFLTSRMSGNPYDTLIEFFELGGAISCEHGMFDRVYPMKPIA